MQQYRKFFDPDSVRLTRDELTHLLRILFYRRGITTDDFVRHHGEWWNHWGRGGQNENESTHRNNQRRALLGDTISWKKFRWLIDDMLRLEIVNLSITVRDHDGKEITYSLRDPIEEPAPDPAAGVPYYNHPYDDDPDLE